jgi:hypothetical protein
MKAGEAEGAKTLNTNLTLCDYLDGGMTTANRWESLKERFRVMVKHYGIGTTLLTHAWFCLKALGRTLNKEMKNIKHKKANNKK